MITRLQLTLICSHLNPKLLSFFPLFFLLLGWYSWSGGTGAEGIPSPRRRLPRRRALQAGAGRVQHRQVREAEAEDGAGGGRHARSRHPGAPQELAEPVRVNWPDLSRASVGCKKIILAVTSGDGGRTRQTFLGGRCLDGYGSLLTH